MSFDRAREAVQLAGVQPQLQRLLDFGSLLYAAAYELKAGLEQAAETTGITALQTLSRFMTAPRP